MATVSIFQAWKIQEWGSSRGLYQDSRKQLGNVWPDCFPYTDVGVPENTMASRERIYKRQKWDPVKCDLEGWAGSDL